MVEKTTERSPLWYELPLLFSIIGGIIAYYKIRKDDPKKARNCLILGSLAIFAILFYFGDIAVFGTANPFYVVASNSMIPELEVGDALVVQANHPFEDVKIGDIIVFNRPLGHDRIIVHRVDSIIDDNPLTLRTKGDANPSYVYGTDFPITEEEYLGIVEYVIPQAEHIWIFSHSFKFFILFLILITPIIMHKKFLTKKLTEEEKKFGKKCECEHFRVEHKEEWEVTDSVWLGEFNKSKEIRTKCRKCDCQKYKKS